MSAIFEGRKSDSPYIEMIWRGRVEQDYSPVCPADANWNLLFTQHQGKVHVTAEGATTQFVPKNQFEGAEFLVIKFKLGVFIPYLSPDTIVNRDATLPDAASKSFWLNSFAWEMPDFENVETFVEGLVHQDILVTDPVVKAVLDDQQQAVSSRTVRRRFLQATGLTPTTIHQIKRANDAAALLGQGLAILDVVYETGYADQSHLTRSLKRFTGQTPAEMVRISQPA